MIKYFVNDKKKTVVSKFENKFYNTDLETWTEYLVRHVHKLLESSNNFVYTDQAIYKTVYKIAGNVDSYCGIALCSGDDTFDVEKGKELAKKRLLRKYYGAQECVALKFFEILNKSKSAFLGDIAASHDKARKFKVEIDAFKR